MIGLANIESPYIFRQRRYFVLPTRRESICQSCSPSGQADLARLC
jgi:hypothetical protein